MHCKSLKYFAGASEKKAANFARKIIWGVLERGAGYRHGQVQCHDVPVIWDILQDGEDDEELGAVHQKHPGSCAFPHSP